MNEAEQSSGSPAVREQLAVAASSTRQLLPDAVRIGFTDVAHMKKDTDPHPLREPEDI